MFEFIRHHARVGVLAGICMLSFAGCGFFGSTENTYQPPPPPGVTVMRPVSQTVTIFCEQNGETEAVERAEVRARVQGPIEQLKFEPGQDVEAGDVLYVIEKDQYLAVQQSAKAALAVADAAIKVAESTVETQKAKADAAARLFVRVEALRNKGAATEADYDAALADRDSSQADLEAAKSSVSAAQAEHQQAAAELERANLDLSYTDVIAPISGRVTKTDVKRGNLVERGTQLATVVNRQKVYVNFNIADRTLLQLQNAKRARMETTPQSEKERWQGHTVYLRRELDEGYPFVGLGDYVDEEGVEQETGTLALRAIFDNPEDLLLPGLFVQVRVPIDEQPGALLIPEKAVGRDQSGSFVLTVGADKKVARKKVITGLKLDGWVVVKSEVEGEFSADDWVIVEGAQRARPGSEVKPTQTKLTPPKQPKLETAPTADPTDETTRDKSKTDEADSKNPVEETDDEKEPSATENTDDAPADN